MDVDKRDTPEFKKHIELLTKGSEGAIPYTILLDDKGQKVAAWVGSVPYETMVRDSKPALERLK